MHRRKIGGTYLPERRPYGGEEEGGEESGQEEDSEEGGSEGVLLLLLTVRDATKPILMAVCAMIGFPLWAPGAIAEPIRFHRRGTEDPLHLKREEFAGR